MLGQISACYTVGYCRRFIQRMNDESAHHPSDQKEQYELHHQLAGDQPQDDTVQFIEIGGQIDIDVGCAVDTADFDAVTVQAIRAMEVVADDIRGDRAEAGTPSRSSRE